MSEKLIRTPGSVFVSIESPHAKTTAAAQSQPDAWAKVANAIGSELPPTSVETPEPTPKPETNLTELLADVDAKLEKAKPVRKQTVQDIQVQRGIDYIIQRNKERKAYEKHHDVPAKSATALKLLAEIEGQDKIKVYRCDTDELVMKLEKGSGWVSRCEDWCDAHDTVSLKAVIGDRRIRFFQSYKNWVSERKRDAGKNPRLTIDLQKGRVR